MMPKESVCVFFVISASFRQNSQNAHDGTIFHHPANGTTVALQKWGRTLHRLNTAIPRLLDPRRVAILSPKDGHYEPNIFLLLV
jgi:hypothetical protein